MKDFQPSHTLVQESMETKTDMEADIHLEVQPTITVGEVQKEVEKKMGWRPTSQLKRCAWHPPPQSSSFMVQAGAWSGLLAIADTSTTRCHEPVEELCTEHALHSCNPLKFASVESAALWRKRRQG